MLRGKIGGIKPPIPDVFDFAISLIIAAVILGYLREVITWIAAHPINRLDELLPWNITL